MSHWTYIKKCISDVQKNSEKPAKIAFFHIFWMYTKKLDSYIQNIALFGRGERKKSYTSIFSCDTCVISHI